MTQKALLIPYNSQGEIFIQDRRGHKPPPWGFFGGGIKVGETSLQAILRETKEELDLDLLESNLEYLGEFPTKFYDQEVERSLYLYRTDQVEFTVLEGAGGHWMTFAAAAELMHEGEKLSSCNPRSRRSSGLKELDHTSVIDSMKHYWVQKLADGVVMAVLLLLLLWVIFPSYVHADSPQIAGWVPFWATESGVESVIENLGEADIIYPFVYEVEGEGDIVAKADLDRGVWKELLDEADDARVEVIPTIAWFDGDAIHEVLSNSKKRKALISDIEDLVDDNNYDGINIDFENKNAETIDYFSRFLRDLNKALGRDTLTCAIEARMRPEHRWRNVPATISYANDYKAINKYCDWVEIMAYDQGRADILLNEQRRGVPYSPVADIDWVEHVLKFALEDIDSDKIMLGIPTYGRAFDVTVAPDWYRDYKPVASVEHSRAVVLANDIYNVPIGRTAGGEAVITYFPEDSVWKIFNALPTPAGTPPGFEAAAKALLVANLAKVEIPVRLLTWGDATAAEDKIDLAKKYDLKGVAFFKFDGEEDENIWKLF